MSRLISKCRPAAPEVDDASAEDAPGPAPRRERILLTGDVPDPMDGPSGCAFRTRCPYAVDLCAAEQPPLREAAPGAARPATSP